MSAVRSLLLGGLDAGRLEHLAHATSQEKSEAVQELIRKTSATAAATTLQPLPGVDAAILTTLQRRLIRSIGVIRGRRLTAGEVRRFFHALRAPIVEIHSTLAATKLVEWIPWVPGVFAASLAYALTYAVGQVSDEYITSPGITEERLRSRVHEVSRERLAELLHEKWAEIRSVFGDEEERR